MCPAGKLFNIREEDGSIVEYARHFWKVAHWMATEKTCLLVFYWGGLAEPFKSLLYWVPEESLEDYINLALNLSGSAFRVELATVPAHIAPEVAVSAHKAPEVASSAHKAPEAVASAHGSPKAAVPAHIPLEVVVIGLKAPKASCPFLGHPGLITSVQDLPLMFVVSGFVCSRPIQGAGNRSQSSRSGEAR